jgi:hypothetical protein
VALVRVPFYLINLLPTSTTIKTPEDAIKFFRLLRAGCRMRSIEWWLNDALEEFSSVDEPHAASGWRIHCGVEVTELSTNKKHTL